MEKEAGNHGNPTKSSKERDLLSRSNKKHKRKITHLIFERNASTDEQMIEAEETNRVETEISKSISRNPNQPSFRDMLRGENLQQTSSQFEGAANSDDEDVSDDDIAPEDLELDDKCPVILLTKEEKAKNETTMEKLINHQDV